MPVRGAGLASVRWPFSGAVFRRHCWPFLGAFAGHFQAPFQAPLLAVFRRHCQRQSRSHWEVPSRRFQAPSTGYRRHCRRHWRRRFSSSGAIAGAIKRHCFSSFQAAVKAPFPAPSHCCRHHCRCHWRPPRAMFAFDEPQQPGNVCAVTLFTVEPELG